MAENGGNLLSGLEPLFTKLNSLGVPQRVGIFVGSIVLIVGLYVWLLYLPKTKEIERLEVKDKNLVRQVSTARRKASKLKKIRIELENRKEEYVLVMNALPDTKEIPGILSSISSSAKESGLELNKITPGQEKSKDFYAEIPISMEVNGDFHQIALFFDKVSRFGRVVDITSVKMKSSKDNKMLASCSAVTYRFLKDNMNSKKKKKKRK